MEGWVKVYRKLLDSSIFKNEKLLKVWVWCLLKASHQDGFQLVGMQKVPLKSGQFVFGRKKAAEELNMSESLVYRYIQFLKDEGNIGITANNKFSVVTIEKWEEYQFKNEKVNSKMNNKWTTNEQQMNTNKNVKNNKNIYLYILNKYRSAEKDFGKRLKIVSKMRKDEKWNELTQEEQLELQTEIFREG